ncbi:MAG: chemotaxis-specific protein-glutamate methyltransferase CheB [Polyangia bacterium]|jgi:two-component system chemotaxis response regulator CheB|nr:chemotaxis-specific protein-glutamate methyltransferase CheB [Polyangia bacterium]
MLHGLNSRRPARVLIVDDSAFVRRTLRTLLLSCGELEVVGAATDGNEGLRLVEELAPDVITLDLEMPRLDGFAFLRILMRRFPIPVVVVSSFAERQTVLRALELGAVDFVAKPEKAASPNLVQIRGELVDKLLAAVGSRVSELRRRMDSEREGQPELSGDAGNQERAGGEGQSSAELRPAEGATGLISAPGDGLAGARPETQTRRPANRVVVVGASTGGPSSLRRLFASLPPELPAAVVVAQHMPPRFTRAFAERLDRQLPWKVREAEQGELLNTGELFIAPGGHHTEVVRREGHLAIEVHRAGPKDRYAPSADRLFSSAADAGGDRVVCLVLTGMGSDGVLGVQYVKVHGGRVLAESEETAVVFGMPRAAIASGAVDEVLPLEAIAPRLVQILGPF